MKRLLVGFTTLFLASILFFSAASISAQDIVGMIKRVKPSVVTVLSHNAFGVEEGLGSGFFIARDRIVTNFHVVRKACSLKIRLNDSSEYDVQQIVSRDSVADLAVLAVNIPANVKIAPLQLRDKLPEQGERIYVVGNPLGFEQSVSDGIVSSVRVVKEYGKLIQFTASISHGNSGSPLLDANGNVLGVVRLTIDEGQNLNFAIPTGMIKTLNPNQKVAFAPIEKSYLGSVMKIVDAFKPDTALYGVPTQDFGSQKEYNVWRLKTAALRSQWDEKIIERNMPRIVRAVKRLNEKFDMYSDTLSMTQASSVVSEALGQNTELKKMLPENAERVAALEYALNLYMKRSAYYGSGNMIGGEANVIYKQHQVWQEFTKDEEYAIITMADTTTISDIDVAVFYMDHGTWKPVAADCDNDPRPMTGFKAPYTGEYAIVWRVAKFVGSNEEGVFGALYLKR